MAAPALPRRREHFGWDFAARVARFEAEFLSRPWKYAAQFRPTKLPPLPPPVDFLLASLPIRGYAEQTLGDALKAALTELAVMRPKHPTAGCRETALKFLEHGVSTRSIA